MQFTQFIIDKKVLIMRKLLYLGSKIPIEFECILKHFDLKKISPNLPPPDPPLLVNFIFNMCYATA